MKRIISLVMCIVMLCSMFAVTANAAENYFDTFDSEIHKLWFSVVFNDSEDNIYDFLPKHVKWYTNYKIDMYQFDSYEKEFVYDTYSYTMRYYAIPADVYEAEALKHFNISDINALRNDTYSDPVYNAETNTYDMPDAGGMGDSITYVTKGYKDLGNGKYEVYGYTVEQAYDKPDGAVEGVDYIVIPEYGNAAEILKCLKVTIEYNGTDVKFISWETITLNEVPSTEELIVAHVHTPSSWITDKKATVNRAGSKHKECTECGEVLETATIKQLKCSKPKMKTIANTQSGVKITWGKVSGADTYRVYRKTKNGDWKYLGSTSKTYYTDKTAKSGTKYYYAVRARNEAGNSSLSSELSKYYLADPTLKTPKSTKSGVSLKWTKTAGAQGYIIYRKTGSGSYQKLVTEKGVSNLSYVDKSAKKGKKYTYKVKAYYSKTYSAYSNTKTIKDKY